VLGRVDRLFAHLEEWFALAGARLQTTREHPELPFGLHAWGAHPIYHSYAAILGIRPTSMGFREVVVRPCWGRSRRSRRPCRIHAVRSP
jgi:hypothetical protein